MYNLVDRLNLFIEGIILCCEHFWLTMTPCGVPAGDKLFEPKTLQFTGGVKQVTISKNDCAG
jgi:hypothetical protein